MKFGTGVVFTEVVDPAAVSPKQNRPNDSLFYARGYPPLQHLLLKSPTFTVLGRE